MKGLVVTLITIFFVSSISNTSARKVKLCGRDPSEELYKADTVIVGKIKSIQGAGSSKDPGGKMKTLVLSVRVNEILKDRGELISQGTPTTMVKRTIKFHLPENLACKRIRKREKYVLIISKSSESGAAWRIDYQPIRRTKKTRKLLKKMFCSKCTTGIKIRKMPNHFGVKIDRWRNITCKLINGIYPSVSFKWFHQDREINFKDVKGIVSNYRVKTHHHKSMLSIRGTIATAGNYKCMATSIAGKAVARTQLYVHGEQTCSRHVEYCLNGGICKIIQPISGVKQVMCECIGDYHGERCQDKMPSSNLSLGSMEMTGTLIAIICVGVIIIVLQIFAIRAGHKQKSLIKSIKNQTTADSRLNDSTATRNQASPLLNPSLSWERPISTQKQLQHSRNYIHQNGSFGSNTIANFPNSEANPARFRNYEQTGKQTNGNIGKSQNFFPKATTIKSDERLTHVALQDGLGTADAIEQGPDSCDRSTTVSEPDSGTNLSASCGSSPQVVLTKMPPDAKISVMDAESNSSMVNLSERQMEVLPLMASQPTYGVVKKKKTTPEALALLAPDRPTSGPKSPEYTEPVDNIPCTHGNTQPSCQECKLHADTIHNTVTRASKK